MLTTLGSLLLAFTTPPSDRITEWSEDALFLVEEIERRHPDPWFGCPREEFELEVDAFLGGVEGWDEARTRTEFLRLFARLSLQGRDGHAAVWPMQGRVLPLQLYAFVDGWFVVEADDSSLVGARVTALGGVPIDEACARLAPLLTRDNDWNLRSKLGRALPNVELLAGVGIACPAAGMPLMLEQEGRGVERVLAPVALDLHRQWGRPALPARGEARWLQRRDEAFRLEVLAAERTLYVQYNEVAASDARGRTLTDFVAEVERTFVERSLARLVLDVRSNGGGDNTTFRPWIETLKRPPFDQAGVVFALIGRETFSAAGNFVTALERETKALLIGEPTGGAPNQYGDAQTVVLPHHKDLLVRVSTRYHEFAPEDPRLTHEPQLLVPLRARDWLTGADPVLAAALAYAPPK